jgi:hypothetical protein
MEKRYFNFLTVSILFLSPGIMFTMQLEKNSTDQQTEQKKDMINDQKNVTKKWLWNAAVAVGGIALVGLVAYNFLTTPLAPTNVTLEQALDTPGNIQPTIETVPEQFSIESPHVQSQFSLSAKKLYKNRMLYNEVRTIAIQSFLVGFINLTLFAISSLPMSPAVPASMFLLSALSTPVAYYYRGQLPPEMRDASHPNIFQRYLKLKQEGVFGNYPGLWKH